LLAVSVRSGVIETEHLGAFAAVDRNGRLIAKSGDVDRPFFIRSSAKPFQAWIAQEAGADLSPTELALSASSHDGTPVHVSIVESMLSAVGLDQDDLRCPEDWPLSPSAKEALLREGHRTPRRIWHNCSGKHAGWLRACVANRWPTDSYLAPDHPLQVRIRELVGDLGVFDVGPVGIDGCGAPVLRTSVLAMATMYGRLGTDERFREVFDAMHRYPTLVSGVGNGDAVIATAFDAVAKRGALGCIGVSVRGQIGVAAKSWDGSDRVAAMTAAAGLVEIAQPSSMMIQTMSDVLRPPVLGGGEVVGNYESRLRLDGV
jgi:L-asparaginase II